MGRPTSPSVPNAPLGSTMLAGGVEGVTSESAAGGIGAGGRRAGAE